MPDDPDQDPLASYSLRAARPSDAAAVSTLVEDAYAHYVTRIDRTPQPMTLDYAQVIAEAAVTVAECQDEIVGVLVLSVYSEGFCVSNVAVHPAHRGRGLGRRMLALAETEAQRSGFGSIYLFTHELMHENLALYTRVGYVEYARRDRDGATVVFLRKPL